MNNYKKMSFKRVVSTILLLLISLLYFSSCGSAEEIIISNGDKKVSKEMFEMYLNQSKANVISSYKSYYEAYPDYFKDAFGFLPDGTEEYWQTDFWDEFIPEVNMTAKEYLIETTTRACKEYVVFEKIAKDYGYSGNPVDLENLKNENISKFGSMEAWNIDVIGRHGITASELIDLSFVSSYGKVLPQHIFGEKGKNIPNERAVQALKDSVQFMYSVYYYQTDVEEPTESSGANENETSDEKEDKPTVEDYNEFYKNKMHSNYVDVTSGKKTFEEIWKDSDDYKTIKEKAPNGVVLTIKEFNSYFSTGKESFQVGEMFVAENESGIFLIKVVQLTDEYIQEKKAYLLGDMFEEVLEKYFVDVVVNEDLIKKIEI